VQGVDAVFYLRALKLYIVLTVGMNIGSLLVLLPIDLTARPAAIASSNSTMSNTTSSADGSIVHASSGFYLDDNTNLATAPVNGMARLTMASLPQGSTSTAPLPLQTNYKLDKIVAFTVCAQMIPH